jgi:hypothetical protein
MAGFRPFATAGWILARRTTSSRSPFKFGDRKVVGVEVEEVTDAQWDALLGHTHDDRRDDTRHAVSARRWAVEWT